MKCRLLVGHALALALTLAVRSPELADAAYAQRAFTQPLHDNSLSPELLVNLWQLVPKSSVEKEHRGHRRSAEAGSRSNQQVKEGENKQGQPVSIQVPQDELDRLSAKLSNSCEERISAILRGEGPMLHTFSGDGTSATFVSCRQLNGSLCATEANVIHFRNSNGRTMRSTLEAEGQGCLPSECLDKPDLEILAGFMQVKAKELVPGVGVRVELRVNCTESGGSTATIGFNSTELPVSRPGESHAALEAFHRQGGKNLRPQQ